MAYTHIQYIAYKVPTVIKVYDSTPPLPASVPGLNVNGVPQPPYPFYNPVTHNTIEYYDNVLEFFNPPPANPQDKSLWVNNIRDYLNNLINYRENPNNGNEAIRNDADELISFLKYHTGYYSWTIPSATDAIGTPVAINRTRERNNYTLRDSDNGNNLTVLNNNTDAKNRIIRFLNVLEDTARNNNHVKNNDATVLKVFTAPEFYFRPEESVNPGGEYRAYTEPVYKAIKDVLKCTIQQEMLPLLDHWLIVPGTIMWYLGSGTALGNNRQLAEDTYFNSCMYLYNAPRIDNVRAIRTVGEVEKSEASYMDGIPYNNWDHGKNAPGIFPKYYNDACLNKHLFTIDGIKTGLEICLEHIFIRPNGPRKNDMNKYGILVRQVFRNRYDYRDLQLLIAGGMPWEHYSIATNHNGIFCRNDGWIKQDVGNNENRYVDGRHTKYYQYKYAHFQFQNINKNSSSIAEDDDKKALKSPTMYGDKELQSSPQGEQYGIPFNQQEVVVYDKTGLR